MIKWIRPHWKVGWFLLVLALLTYLVISKWSVYLNGTATPFEIIIFLIWVALLFAPLFREVSFFGVSLKNEIDSLKGEIINLKYEMHSTQNVYVYPPPSPDSKIPEIRKIAEATLKKEFGELAVESRPAPEATIPDDIAYLFAVRYNIEHELKRITDLYWISKNTEFHPKTVIQKLEFLVHMKVIHSNLAYILKEMFAWGSAAIHGEQISEQAVQFMRQDAPAIIEALKAIPEEAKTGKEQT